MIFNWLNIRQMSELMLNHWFYKCLLTCCHLHAGQWVWVGWPFLWSSSPRTLSQWSTLVSITLMGWHTPRVERGNRFKSASRYEFIRSEFIWLFPCLVNHRLSLQRLCPLFLIYCMSAGRVVSMVTDILTTLWWLQLFLWLLVYFSTVSQYLLHVLQQDAVNLCVSVLQFTEVGMFETVWQVKYYNYNKRDHCQWGNSFNSIEYECKPNDTRTLMWVNKEMFIWVRNNGKVHQHKHTTHHSVLR